MRTPPARGCRRLCLHPRCQHRSALRDVDVPTSASLPRRVASSLLARTQQGVQLVDERLDEPLRLRVPPHGVGRTDLDHGLGDRGHALIHTVGRLGGVRLLDAATYEVQLRRGVVCLTAVMVGDRLPVDDQFDAVVKREALLCACAHVSSPCWVVGY